MRHFMGRIGCVLAMVGCLSLVPEKTAGQTGVTVSNVTVAQRNDNSKLVDIHLSASSACTVWRVVSGDGRSVSNTSSLAMAIPV